VKNKILIISVFACILAASLVLAASSESDMAQGLVKGIQGQIQVQHSDGIKFSKGGVEAHSLLNITEETPQNISKLKVQLSNGRNAEIKIMPDTASATALAKLGMKVCNETNNCTIQLKEVGQGNQTKAVYEVQLERHSRILGIFSAKMHVNAEIDSENGEVIQVKKPWWAFLATEPEE